MPIYRITGRLLRKEASPETFSFTVEAVDPTNARYRARWDYHIPGNDGLCEIRIDAACEVKGEDC